MRNCWHKANSHLWSSKSLWGSQEICTTNYCEASAYIVLRPWQTHDALLEWLVCFLFPTHVHKRMWVALVFTYSLLHFWSIGTMLFDLTVMYTLSCNVLRCVLYFQNLHTYALSLKNDGSLSYARERLLILCACMKWTCCYHAPWSCLTLIWSVCLDSHRIIHAVFRSSVPW